MLYFHSLLYTLFIKKNPFPRVFVLDVYQFIFSHVYINKRWYFLLFKWANVMNVSINIRANEYFLYCKPSLHLVLCLLNQS